jgi:hypothetical protein
MRHFYVLLIVALMPAVLAAQTPARLEFNRDIRPILSDACFHCHGPDKNKRKADLSLDTPAGAFEDRGGYQAIVPKHPDKSAVLERLLSSDPAKRMPPRSSGLTVKKEHIDLIRRWIAEGAEYQTHWAFLAPRRSDPPQVKDTSWPRNDIDRFILGRLEKEGLKPSPEADPITLLRRVSLDLTGLPPTLAEVDAFLADASGDRYERAVDRLLRSPRYGERMAQRWLDAARYADTNGYQNDGFRVMHRWRDWVIDAFNNNMPFDQFTIEQLAGDMLPNPTLEQRIATGFNRNHRLNSEGGVIPEEYAVEYVVDRVDTTSTVWLGLTMGCARCHDHKYDPLTQKEFYRLFAYFNNVPERGKAIKYGNSPPVVKAPTKMQAKRWVELQKEAADADDRFRKARPRIDKAQAAWEAQSSTLPDDSQWTPDGQDRFEALDWDGTRKTEIAKAGHYSFFERFSIGVWVYPESGDGSILNKVEFNDRAAGYNLQLKKGKLHLHFAKRYLDDAIRVETAEALVPRQWHHVLFTYDGSRVAKGLRLYVNGKLATLHVHLDDLNQDITTNEPLRIGFDEETHFKGRIEGLRLFHKEVAADDAAALAVKATLTDILRIPPGKRSAAQQHKLRWHFIEAHSPKDIRTLYQDVLRTRQALQEFEDTIPTSMVMEEMPVPRPTHVLIRGEYFNKGPRVEPGLPEVLPRMADGVPNNRLGFARWLVQRDNPLTARVAVNRHWQMLFGTGIVKSVEDFGAQGDWPSHPELLDWLALEFMDSGWDVKKLLRTIVTSAAYRQSSKHRPDLLQKDPDNRLLARGTRIRLPAEMIRDQALHASGLLVEKLGGPSVKPYQPPGLAKELHGLDEDGHDHGENLYRRSLYTYWKRTVAPPSLMTFDAANRETCVVRESRTNTPLQALNLMNDVTYVEAARHVAQRVMKEVKTTPERLTRAMRHVLCRPPAPRELDLLMASWQRHRDHYAAQPAEAQKLLSLGESPRDPNLRADELAAFTVIASMLLNLDEAISKE